MYFFLFRDFQNLTIFTDLSYETNSKVKHLIYIYDEVPTFRTFHDQKLYDT